MDDTCRDCGGPTVLLLLFSRVCRDDCARDRPASAPERPVLGPALRGFLRMQVIDGREWAVFRSDIDIDVPEGAQLCRWEYVSSGFSGLEHSMARGSSDPLRSGLAYLDDVVSGRAYWPME